MVRQPRLQRKDGDAVEKRRSLVSVDGVRIEVAGKMKCLMSNYDPNKPQAVRAVALFERGV